MRSYKDNPTKMSTPFFSIIIPTRNRPSFLKKAIESLNEQHSFSLEIIISDNSSLDQKKANQKIIGEFKNPSIKYISPPYQMDMGSHWEWALQHATGKYISFLTDRMKFRQNGLQMLYDHLSSSSNEIQLLTYHWDIETDDGIICRPTTQQLTKMVCTDVINDIANCLLGFYLPRMLNSFISSELISDLKKKYKNIFSSISPDYYFCFLILGHINFFHYFNQSILISQGDATVSNGRSFYLGKTSNATFQDFNHFLTSKGGLYMSPIPQKTYNFTVPLNGIFHEYNLVKSTYHNRLPPLDLEKFYSQAIQKLLLEVKMDPNWKKKSLKAIEDFCREKKLTAISPLRKYFFLTKAKLKKIKLMLS